jgi:hypothetical protein
MAERTLKYRDLLKRLKLTPEDGVTDDAFYGK